MVIHSPRVLTAHPKLFVQILVIELGLCFCVFFLQFYFCPDNARKKNKYFYERVLKARDVDYVSCTASMQ